jgi:hypothetical protein
MNNPAAIALHDSLAKQGFDDTFPDVGPGEWHFAA